MIHLINFRLFRRRRSSNNRLLWSRNYRLLILRNFIFMSMMPIWIDLLFTYDVIRLF